MQPRLHQKWVWSDAGLHRVRDVEPSAGEAYATRALKDGFGRSASAKRIEISGFIQNLWKENEQGQEVESSLMKCVGVALQTLVCSRNLSVAFLDMLNSCQVQDLLEGLLKYFEHLFFLCDELSAVQAPTVVNMVAMEQKWRMELSQALTSLVPPYTDLLITPQSKGHHRRSISPETCRKLKHADFDCLVVLMEEVICLSFEKRDKNLIAEEIMRLFNGPIGQFYSISNPAARINSALDSGKSFGAAADSQGCSGLPCESGRGDKKYLPQSTVGGKPFTRMSLQPSGLVNREPPSMKYFHQAVSDA
ncbi:hypothetical protein FHG87_023001 [Trinorchestia longiramus]|nr:hypothetical protein FHG87_023001 [Trinorchestia longiramus]